MPVDEPSWWYGAPGRSIWPVLLDPVARVYGHFAARRLATVSPVRVSLPVICVGNFTVGGTGKTPMVREIIGRVRALGRLPVVLSRGYGGRVAGPHWVADADPPALVGDEPRLLAADAPVVVSRDRPAGARAIAERFGRSAVVVMDDGLQNPSLAKTLSLAVVDARRGFGNGRVFPAGPLRAPLPVQWPLIDALVVNRPPGIGPETADVMPPARWQQPVIQAVTEPAADLSWLAGTPVLGWAGIANPQRFFALLEGAGADVTETVTFRDHHALSAAEAEDLLDRAARTGARLVTTEKDRARLAGASGTLALLGAQSAVLPIRIRFEVGGAAVLDRLLERALASSP